METRSRAKSKRPVIVISWVAVAAIVFAIFILTPLGGCVSFTFSSGGIADEFLLAASAQDVDRMQSLLSSEGRTRYPPDKLRKDFSGVFFSVYDHIDFRRSSFGTTRGGRNTGIFSGYVKYKGKSEESTLSVSYVQENGKWLIDSISVGTPAIPR
jgi:hypothetical protein